MPNLVDTALVLWRRSFKITSMYFCIFIIPPFRKASGPWFEFLFLNTLTSLCAKLGWDWPSGSWKEGEVKRFQTRCVCETYICPIMANPKDGQVHKDKYIDTSTKMLIYAMYESSNIYYFVLNVYVKVKRFSTITVNIYVKYENFRTRWSSFVKVGQIQGKKC